MNANGREFQRRKPEPGGNKSNSPSGVLYIDSSFFSASLRGFAVELNVPYILECTERLALTKPMPSVVTPIDESFETYHGDNPQ